MYYVLLIVLYPLSLLPLRVLYVLSDILYVVGYLLAGYRKDVVLENLQHAFPEKSIDELKKIRKDFYRAFFDQWIETLKLLSVSEKELKRRIQGNWEVFHRLHREGKNTYAMLGHTFNWEWANVVCQYEVEQQFAGIYMPVDNAAFDRLLQRTRKRSGAMLISMKAKKGMLQLQAKQYIVGLMADQNPSNMQQVAWLNFMHREAPFFNGPEKLARRTKAAIVFAGIKKVRRGHYKVHLQCVTEDASQEPEGQILKQYVSFMEQQLHEQPANWLWTHKRWKYKKPA
jgi:KDO2-lipid IV(A) lauroyltransferase